MVDILHKQGFLDILEYYAKVAPVVESFLKGKKIASKIHLPKGIPFFLKRGSKEKPLYIEDFASVDEKMLKLRGGHLQDVKKQLSEKQKNVWNYFPPRKLADFFYATNDEGVGKPMDRVFLDIDRENFSSEQVQQVACELVKIIKTDEKFNKLLKFKIFIMWTGSSFHIYLLLKKKIDMDFYSEYLSYGKKDKSFIEKWAEQVGKKLQIRVEAGHERRQNAIILDSSGTPSGKLARCPFSLHMRDAREIDGVAVPVSEKELENKKLVNKLKKLDLEKVLNNFSYYEKLL